MHKSIRFNHKAWLKQYIDINTDLRKASKAGFFNLMKDFVFGKTMKNVRKHRENL